MNVKNWLLLSIIAGVCLNVVGATKLEKYGVDPARIVNGEYRGRFAPDADYVLDGYLARDFGELPYVPYRYLTDKEGYDPNALSKVPPVGVHPRVLMSPEDLDRIRLEYAKGDQAGRVFQIIWNEIKGAKPMQHLHGLTSVALVALVTEDDALGKEAANQLVEYAHFVEPLIDILNTHPETAALKDWWYYFARTSVNRVGGVYYKDAYEQGGAKLIHKLAEKGVEFGGGSKASGDLFNTVLRDYDYLYPYMTDEQRDYVRKVIAKASAGKFTAGMGLPGHHFINNHMSMGEDLLILHLAIEGEEGYDPRILKTYSPAVLAKVTYDISEAGIMQEKLKGFIPERAVVAISRRAGIPDSGALPLLRHDHLKALVWAKAMDSINIYIGNQNLGAPELGELTSFPRRWWKGYGSGPWMDQYFSWGFILHMVYPKDPVVDYFYKERLKDGGFGSARPEDGAPLPKPRISYAFRDILLLTASDGLHHSDGSVVDYDKDGLPKELTKENKAFADMRRGVAVSRSSWEEDAMTVHYECRSDIYGGGHETPEAQDFNLSSHGILWSIRRDWYMDCYFRNMVLVDGKAGVYGPAPAKLMKVVDNDSGTTFISDATVQYNWGIGGKCFYEWHKMYEECPMHMSSMISSDMLERGSELPFLPHARLQEQGFSGLDWGGWHGEERGPTYYHNWNNIDHVFRTMHMTKGEKPYLLVIDDVRKDDQVHQYDWCFHVERDVALYSADNPIRNRYLINHPNTDVPNPNSADLILCLKDVPETRYNRYGIKVHRKPKVGDPMLLVRVLNRATDYPYPQPVFEEGAAHGGTMLGSRVRVPALAVDPEFRIMIFPHRFGDKLPVTSWNDDHSKLTVEIGEDVDVYSFARTDRERTVFNMERNGKPITRTGSGPSAPQLDTSFGWTVDQNAPDALRTVVFEAGDEVALKSVPMGQVIRYTLDGTDPTAQSDLYTGPVKIEKSGIFKARTFARYWPYSDKSYSKLFEIQLEPQSAVAPVTIDSALLLPGLACELYEKHYTIFDEKNGMFTGKKKMLPELNDDDLLVACRVPGFDIPKAKSKQPAAEMPKAYFSYSGFIKVEKNGTYSFDVYSCGPVVLEVGGFKAINVTGSYGLSLKHRYGNVVLQPGLHPISLTVCDPSWWKAGREGPYPLTVSMMEPGSSKYLLVSNESLFTDDSNLKQQIAESVPKGKSVDAGKVQTGLVLSCYDRTASADSIPKDGLPPEFFIPAKNESPYMVKPVMGIDASDSAGKLAIYSGFLEVDEPGIYRFKTDEKGANQLWIDDVLVTQASVSSPEPLGAIELEPGSHKFMLHLVSSKGTLQVKAPGRDSYSSLNIGMFVRPTDVKAEDDGRCMVLLDCENMDNDGLLKHDFKGVTVKLRKGELVEGLKGKGIKVKGADSWLEVEGLKTPEDAFSMAFWMKIDGSADRGMLESSWKSHPGARLRGYNLQATYYRGSEIASANMEEFGGRSGKWAQVVITYGRSVKIYVNGELQDWQIKNVPERKAYVSDLILFKELDATFDEISLYNKVLTQDEVKKLYEIKK